MAVGKLAKGKRGVQIHRGYLWRLHRQGSAVRAADVLGGVASNDLKVGFGRNR